MFLSNVNCGNMAVVVCHRLSRYKVKRAIGKGSYGEVFLVTHRGDGKQYVMKKIKLTASSAKERHAAEQEASLLSQLKHPNIVSYKESFQDSQCILHIVMGYCEGGDLATRLHCHHGNLLPETQVVEWFVQITLALQYLHDKNILHRDLKTQNIFLSKNDIIKVGDLGIARVLDGSCDLACTVIGTPYYMSPELFSNQPYNHKSDIWALGCCVYEMATLKHAFSAHNINALMVKIVRGQAPALPEQFSTELGDIVESMLSREADKRPSVHQLLRNEYIRTHIKLFLDRAAYQKRKKIHIQPQKEVTDQRRTGGTKPLRPQPTPPQASSPDITKPPTTPSGLSSARERRRQHRREAGRRERSVPRVSSVESCSSSDSTPSPSPKPPEREQPGVEGGEKRIVNGVTPGSVGGEREQPGVGGGGERIGVTPASVGGEREQPGVGGGGEERGVHGVTPASVGGEVRVESSTSSSSIEDGTNGAGEGEKEEVYTLLNSTLHQEKSDDMATGVISGEVERLRPGRLQERIAALRRECEAALGKDTVTEALSSLDLLDPENDPDMQLLLPLLGDQAHNMYAPKLRQLWLCEDALEDV